MRNLQAILITIICSLGWLGSAHAQVGQQAGIGFYGGTSFLSHVRRLDDYKGFYHPDESRAYYGGAGIYQPIQSYLGFGMELGFQQNRFNYWYATDRIGTSVVTDMTYFSIIATPSLTLNPKPLKGFFFRLALPFAFKAGNKGTYFLEDNPNWVLVRTDYSDQIAAYRKPVYIGPEISLGYMYTWKNGTGIWVRGSTWRAAMPFWKYSFTATPELPTLKRLSIEVGFRFGTPGLQLMGRKPKG
jgi:hypothetical protein